MRKRYLFACALSLGVAIVAACSSSPVSPDKMAGAGAGPDGATLKVTAPTPTAPANGVRIDSLRASLAINGATAHFTSSPAFSYRYEVLDPAGRVAYSGTTSGTRHDVPVDLSLDTRYRWRARAEYQGAAGPWSQFVEFLTIDYRGIVPRPRDGRWPTKGEDVVEYIASVFPEYLEPTPTDDERVVHMEFLRDRIIEAGICGGIDLARNLKRGIGPHSIDAIAWRKRPDFVEVIDIASAYDDHDNHLNLHWVEVLGPPGYDPYLNHPGC